MKKSKVLFFTLLIVVMATTPQGVMSQVTIGLDKEPEPFSVLELISNSSRGLRLPQLTTEQRDDLTTNQISNATDEIKLLAKGLTIYNFTKNCVEYWNGGEWIGAGCTQAETYPCGKVAFRSATSGAIDGWKTFMCYNLGADDMTIEEQTAFLSPKGDFNTIPMFADEAAARLTGYPQVYGSLFQWGRKADGHQNVWSLSVAGSIPEANWDNAGDTFPRGDYNDDWLSGTNPKPARWGGSDNGETIIPERKGPNDPCPNGWRVPSSNEWQSVFGSNNIEIETETSDVIYYEGVNKFVLHQNENGNGGILVYPPIVDESNNITGYSQTATLFLPASGYRNKGGTISGMASSGMFWLSDKNAFLFIGFYSEDQSAFIAAVSAPAQLSWGMNVRCIADN
jgi:uncharacterized protein (TIGR02145 family)